MTTVAEDSKATGHVGTEKRQFSLRLQGTAKRRKRHARSVQEHEVRFPHPRARPVHSHQAGEAGAGVHRGSRRGRVAADGCPYRLLRAPRRKQAVAVRDSEGGGVLSAESRSGGATGAPAERGQPGRPGQRVAVPQLPQGQVVRWLSGSFLAPGRGPHWLQPVAEDSRPACACRRRVAEVTCNLLHRTFLNFVELDRKRADDSFPLAAGGHHEESPVLCKLRDTLREGIALLHRLEDRNPDFMINVASSEGEWQSFVLGCSRNRSVLRLTAEQQRCLEELVASVEVDVVADSNLPSQADLDVIFEHLWKDNLRYIRRNYVPPRNSNF
ncbi:uncharacterized protein LOC134530019 [Bacillus rossius redtenbacheri]|uniref:uncharacterized protein LOC134530019 n=1 Tax=Bacillus rossius redtenbacheri TaxID=93214 RepID=UPI002FDF0765